MESSGANWDMRSSFDAGLARDPADLGHLVWEDLSLDPLEVLPALPLLHGDSCSFIQLRVAC